MLYTLKIKDPIFHASRDLFLTAGIGWAIGIPIRVASLFALVDHVLLHCEGDQDRWRQGTLGRIRSFCNGNVDLLFRIDTLVEGFI